MTSVHNWIPSCNESGSKPLKFFNFFMIERVGKVSNKLTPGTSEWYVLSPCCHKLSISEVLHMKVDHTILQMESISNPQLPTLQVPSMQLNTNF